MHNPDVLGRDEMLDVTDVAFGPSGAVIRGRLYVPRGTQAPSAAVVLGHGWGMVAGGDLEDYARVIAARGIICLTFDFRGLGASDGEPRQEIDPQAQIEDFRTAITFVGSHRFVDDCRIGIWGSSFSGGHVLVVAATDSRVKAVVSQVPTISGYESGLRKTAPRNLAELHDRFHADRLARLNGADPAMVQSVGEDGEAVAYPGAESRDYMLAESLRSSTWRNETTLKSLEMARMYEPATWIDRIGPKPLLMIVASADLQTPTDLQLTAYNRALEPKELLLVDGGHYSVYTDHFSHTSAAAADWFAARL